MYRLYTSPDISHMSSLSYLVYDIPGATTDLYYFIQIPYRLFKSYVYHVAADKFVNIPTKMAASSVERC